MAKHTVNLDELEFARVICHGDDFEAKMARVSPLIGGVKLAYNVTDVPPGKRAFPFHNHHANEQLFFILEGEGVLRFGEERCPVRPGDFIACPSGGPEAAHQLINTGRADLRYLAISESPEADVVQYPDSGKFGAFTGLRPGAHPGDARFAGFWDEQRRLDYWEGE